MKQRICAILAALTAAACLLSACGPEPGAGETGSGFFSQEENRDSDKNGDPDKTEGQEAAAGQGSIAPDSASSDNMSGGEQSSAAAQTTEAGSAASENAGAGLSASENDEGSAGRSGTTAVAQGSSGAGQTETASAAGESKPETAGQTAAAGQEAAAKNVYEKMVPLDGQTLKELQAYLNESSSYGFLLSCYEKPEDIDLKEVFYTGAGAPREKLEEKEQKLLLERLSMEELVTSVTKVKEEYIEELLSRKAGITYKESNYPLDTWVRIRRYGAYYHMHGDTNQVGIRCIDGWRQGNTYILHYQTQSGLPEQDPAASDTHADTAGTAAEAAGSAPAKQDEDARQQEKGSSRKEAVSVQQETASIRQNYAYYTPTYEVELEKTGDEYQFRSNILWIQKDLIEAQSYKADLKPMGEVFFAPIFPDTEANPRADVTFALIRGKGLKMTLAEMEAGNVRSDRIFTGVDAVDFTDYNGDGYTDILTVCSYQLVDEKGTRLGDTRETRVYTMQVYGEGEQDSWLLLDKEKTEAVNRDVEILNITNVTEYLTGKSDGKSKKFSSWKEAFADHIRGVDEKEYAGFALIYLNDDRTPELVQVGATTAKGATVVVYRSGLLEETWLNRNTFQYLEYENLLYSASGIDNLHYDSIYSIVRGRLGISVQGYYGNSSFARVRYDESGKESYDYFWDGGEVSKNGYRDGLDFVFDSSRAKECGREGLLTAEEMLKKLK